MRAQGPARRYRATVAYDGTRYHGFQVQANAEPTIQGRLEAALERIGGVPPGSRVMGAGRTDAGVHATGQVIAFDLAWRHGLTDLRNALNANLPADIAIWEVAEARPGFHPRYDALSRCYAYDLFEWDRPHPLLGRAWQVQGALDVAAIRLAVRALPGEHDFAAFGQPPQGENSLRNVLRAEWIETGNPTGGKQHQFVIEANAFLYRMVRSIVGTLVEVGMGRMTPDEFRGILAACNRSLAGPSAPPHGLTLIEVKYADTDRR
jgi:tRNA pseudouridine38-40 synthase